MRTKVRAAYSGDKWKHKVDNMPDYQIMAIYFKLIKKENHHE